MEKGRTGMEAVGNRMLELRKGFGLSQAKIAKTLHITQSPINRYEHNESAIPDSVLLKYANFFDVSLDYIFGRCEEPQGKEVFGGRVIQWSARS